MSNIRINETHIMVIRKDPATGRLVTDYLPLEFEERAKLNELEKLSKTAGITGEDMFKATQEKGLGYLLDYYGYGFGGIGSLEEYFAYDPDEYYRSLQMGLPVLYYNGRNDPPHPEIWINYFLRMVKLYSGKVFELSKNSKADITGSLSYLNKIEKSMLKLLLEKHFYEFTPVELSRIMNVTNKTIINRCVRLASNGFIIPNIVNTRIRSYTLSDFSRTNKKKLLKELKNI